jgi:predicted AAA+ superfamily ATPase
MRRIYEEVLLWHLNHYQQMAFLSGPRQVGKTTISHQLQSTVSNTRYFNWDSVKDRSILLGSYEGITEGLGVEALLSQLPLVIFDEVHKYKNWKNFLKGFFDNYKGTLNIFVTGSAKLNVFRRGGDSLMGRYFLYRVHPLSTAELLRTELPKQCWSAPKELDRAQFLALLKYGGYPEPFVKQDDLFYHRWQNLRLEQLFREDVRQLSQVQDIAQMELLAYQLQYQAGQLTNYSNLATKIRVSEPTIRRWIQLMESFYYCFTIKPWSTNIARSLIKEPKLYLWDWSLVQDEGAKIENFVAGHLLKAVHFWNDIGFGKFDLYYLRDKSQREVDFIMTKDRQPWILIEVKSSEKESLSKNLIYFKEQTKAPYAFQLAFNAPYVEVDCSTIEETKIVSMQTFLSQLV